ncbi:T9SS type A sorting domain-containing protein [Dyadobacter psychrotolerans]|uniref:T9SS type A sorting domain-containing protein n=1 Tax=Dyadobacter psychrotolerans TaxID=2541721 RepID=A0A4R5DSQ6_9BACT|nr:T9SS type A sorting domain-containing protein [Dyadobacter psychrotolerans]TDE17389.1 T9SS type A sorting domain-containing protein [Dyadobacter psychrotolerans]
MFQFLPNTLKVLFLFQFISIFSFAQNWDKVIKATADDREFLSYYGSSVSISGNYAVVGAVYERKDVNGSNSLSGAGAAYILFHNGTNWVQVKKICAPVRSEYDNFGASVAISGETVIVGAPNEKEDESDLNPINYSGAAYIFSKHQGGTDNWGFTKKVTAAIRSSNSYFGQKVSINGDYALVGVYGENISGNSSLMGSGAAYLFKKDQGGLNKWGLLKHLIASDRDGSDQFGTSVAISGNYAIVGAGQKSHVNPLIYGAGAAYIFKKDHLGQDNWGQVKKIEAPLQSEYDTFGTSVAISDEYAVVGAVNDDEDENEDNKLSNTGSAYIFKNDLGGSDGWGMIKKITAKFRESQDGFGNAVAISNDFVVVGAKTENHDVFENNHVENSGSAYVYSKNSGGADQWMQTNKLTARLRATDTNFGFTLAIDGANLLIGSNLEDADATDNNNVLDAGAVYFFSSSSPLPLPIKLTSFNVQKNENRALLSWNTASEYNSDNFEIQRSGNGKNWNKIGKVQAAVESHLPLNYTFTDHTPADGENLYRLKMTDTDGTFAYSTVKMLNFSRRDILLYPNPVSDKLFISDDDNKIQSVNLFNSLGQIVSKSSKIGDGLSVKHLQPGLYLIQITQSNGESKFSKVVVTK